MLKRNEGKGPVHQGRVWEGNGNIDTLFALMAALAFALVMASGAALAQTKTEKPDAESTAVPKPSKVDVRGIPTEGLTAPIGMDDRLRGHSDRPGHEPLATVAGEAGWLDGTTSNTYYYNPIQDPVADDGMGRLLGQARRHVPQGRGALLRPRRGRERQPLPAHPGDGRGLASQ